MNGDTRDAKTENSDSWAYIILVYVSGIVMGCFWFWQDIPRHTWLIPAERSLIVADGHFFAAKRDRWSPYEFVTDAGDSLTLGCLPESTQNMCLEDMGLNLRTLAQQKSRIGFFYVRNWRTWRARKFSDVLVTLSTNGTPLLSYEKSESNLRQWSIDEERIKHSPGSIVMDVAFTLLIFAYAFWLTLQKKKKV
jgi:hypothetical protein